MTYNPPVRNPTKTITWLALVSQADPDWASGKHRETEYQFSNGKRFFGDPIRRGAANRLSNEYTVGQPYGAADPLITAALAPTVGNAVPGLYEGVDDGMGWA